MWVIKRCMWYVPCLRNVICYKKLSKNAGLNEEKESQACLSHDFFIVPMEHMTEWKLKKTNKQINKAEVVVTANEVENCVQLKNQSAPPWKVIIDPFNNDLMISEMRGAATKHHKALNHHGGQICEMKFGFSWLWFRAVK